MAEQNETVRSLKQNETQQNKDLKLASESTMTAPGNRPLASSPSTASTPLTAVNQTTSANQPLVSCQSTTLTPFTPVNQTTGENSAGGVLFFLNSPYTSQGAAPTVSESTSNYSNAVFLQQPVTLSLLSQVQNVMSNTTKTSTGNDNENNVIEKAMDLANLGDVSGGSSLQHPATNAALTLVSLGSTVGQPVQEIVIDESGQSSFAHNSDLVEVSVNVENETSAAVTTPTSQAEFSGLCTVVERSLCDNSEETNTGNPESKNEMIVREVVTQTGGGAGEVVILRSTVKAKHKSISTVLTEQSIERKRIAELREAQRNLVIDKERTFPCEKCEKKFHTKHDVKRHMVVHSDSKPYSCETCGKTFRTGNELNLHIPVHNKDTPYKCEFCSKEFRTKGCFKSHIKYHIGDKRHKCEVCGRAFVKSADLKRHVAGHNNEKNFKCEECDSAFTRRDNLKAHMLLHSREKVVTCDKCNKEFINNVYLKRHMHVHKQAKKKPYECQWCPKTYEQLEGLRRHIRQHVGDEKFVCEHCSKKFITAIQLKRHLWLSHEQNSPYRRSIL